MNHDAFLRAVLDAPDDDAPRLLYADWPEERGDPRGEFIRVQCALGRRDCSACDRCGRPWDYCPKSSTPPIGFCTRC